MKINGMLACVAMLVCLLLAPALSDEYTWDGSTANWNTNHWGGGAPYDNAGDVGNVNSGNVYTSGSFLGQLNINAGGTLKLGQGGSATADNLHLNGGAISGHLQTNLDGNIYVDALSYLSGNTTSRIYADLHGSADLVKTGGGNFSIAWDASDWTGRLIISDSNTVTAQHDVNSSGIDLSTTEIYMGSSATFKLWINPWVVRNDFYGAGTLDSTVPNSVTLQGSKVGPGDTADSIGIGILTFSNDGNVIFSDDAGEKSQLVIDVIGGTTAGTDYDQLALTGGGNLNLGSGKTDMLLNVVVAPAASDELTIVLLDGDNLSGTFDTVSYTPESLAQANTVIYNADSVVLTDWVAVPEPATLALLAVGGLATAAGRRRRAIQ